MSGCCFYYYQTWPTQAWPSSCCRHTDESSSVCLLCMQMQANHFFLKKSGCVIFSWKQTVMHFLFFSLLLICTNVRNTDQVWNVVRRLEMFIRPEIEFKTNECIHEPQVSYSGRQTVWSFNMWPQSWFVQSAAKYTNVSNVRFFQGFFFSGFFQFNFSVKKDQKVHFWAANDKSWSEISGNEE